MPLQCFVLICTCFSLYCAKLVIIYAVICFVHTMHNCLLSGVWYGVWFWFHSMWTFWKVLLHYCYYCKICAGSRVLKRNTLCLRKYPFFTHGPKFMQCVEIANSWNVAFVSFVHRKGHFYETHCIYANSPSPVTVSIWNCDDCLEDKRECYVNCSVIYCANHMHGHTRSCLSDDYLWFRFRLNPLDCRGNCSATSNNMKLVHWPLI